MRRARISIKPNVRPGSRGVAPPAEIKSSQESTAVDDTQQTPTPSTQSQPEVKESAVATGDGNVPGSSSEKASLNTNDGAPSSAITSATTAPQRRSRFSATPNLARPKVRSTAPPSAGKTASLPSEPSKTSSPLKTASSFPQAPVPVAVINENPQNSTLSDATSATNHPPSSPCLPSTSGCPESPPSTQSLQESCQTPKRIPNEDIRSQKGPTPASLMLSPCVKLSRVDGPESPVRFKMCLEKQRVLKALKLKELMKLERRKEIMQRKSGRQKREHSFEMDRDKMTLADFIYYLPESNPMKCSTSMEESKTTTPSSPVVKKNIIEEEEEEEDDEDDDEMLVPKVRVAEDGSLILDEESLTVRVQRASKTVVEKGNPLFERGSTTTYSSFKKNSYVKAWSVRETDMFYLAISMVGTDFSLIAQLLTHRSRAEIRRKFKREEKENAWRVDKAFRNKRPYDAEFFSFLLKRILIKDKEKGKSIKLVVKSDKRKKSKGGKKAKPLVNEDSINNYDELCSVDSSGLDLEKENEDNSNVKEADSSKKRKRTKRTKSCEKTCEPKKKKKTQKKGKCPAEGEDDDLVCGELDSVDADNEDQSCLPVSTKKRKPSKKVDQEGQEEKTDAKGKRQKKKKKTLEEPTDGESGAVNEEHSEVSTVSTKKRKRSKQCAEEHKKSTKAKAKKSKASQEECSGSEPGAEGIDVSTGALSVEEDQGEKLIPESAAQEEISQSSSKRSKRPVPNLAKRKAKTNPEPKATVEAQDESCREAESELRIISDTEKQLQSQPVVVLERTPPRFKDSQSSSESQDHPQSCLSPRCSPGRQMRAERVKRNLTATDEGSEALKAGLCAEENQSEKLIPEQPDQEISQSSFKSSLGWQTRGEKDGHSLTASEEERMDDCWSGSDISPEDLSSTAMPDHVVIQKSKRMESDQRTEEGNYLPHVEFLTTAEVNGKTLLKRAVVLVSREEVERYLRIQVQTNVDESESQLVTTSARAHHDGVHSDGHEEEESSGFSIAKRLCQNDEMKESDTASAKQNVTEKRRRFSKPTPNLRRTGQSCRSPLNEQTTDFRQNTSSLKHDSTQLECSSDVEDQVNAETLNVGLEQEHTERPAEESASSVTSEEKSSLDVKVQDDIKTTVDDPTSLTSVETDPREKEIEDQEVSSFHEKPQALDTTPLDKEIPEKITDLEKSPSQTFEDEDQEEEDSEPSESEINNTVIGEPHTELERIIPVDLQTSEPEEDPTEISEKITQPYDMDHDEVFFREEKLLSSEVDLQECKQDEDLLPPVPLLASTQASAPQVPMDCTIKGNKEQTDAVVRDAASVQFEPHSPGSSLSDHLTEQTSNMCDADTLMFSAPAAEDIQIPDEQVSQMQDETEEQSADTEDCSINLDKTEVLEKAGVEKVSTDNQSEEEPTFILTLYEIPTSQLFQEAVSGQQDTPPYNLQPAQVHTPSLCSQPIPLALETPSTSLHILEDTEKLSNTVSYEDNSLVPLSNDVVDAKDTCTPLIPSQESSCDDVNSVISTPEILSCSSTMPTDVLKMDEKLTKTSKPENPTQRRSKIKVKPNLKHCVKAGPPGKGHLDNADSQNMPSSSSDSNRKTSAQETVDPENLVDSESRAHDGHDSVMLIVPVTEKEHHAKGESPLRTDDQMGEDVDSPVHSTAVNESKEETEDGHKGVSHMVLADAFVLLAPEMEDVLDVFNKDMKSLRDCQPEKPEDLSVCLPDREKTFSVVDDQREMADISEEPDTRTEPSGVTSSADHEKSVPLRTGKLQIEPRIPKRTSTEDDFPRQKLSDTGSNDPSSTQTISPALLIKEELHKGVEERTVREYFLEEESNARLAETSECTHSPPIELKIKGDTEDVSHTVLSDILVPHSDEIEDVHLERRRPVLQMSEKRQQTLTAEQDTHSHEGVSHMLLTDILMPICEDMSGDLSQELMTAGDRSPHQAERPLVREDLDNPDLICAVSQPSNVGPSTSPKRKRHTQSKDKLLVKMIFPKTKGGDSPKSTSLNSPEPECTSEPKCTSTQSSLESFTDSDLLPSGSLDDKELCGDVSQVVLSDILLPVLDKVAKHSLHREESSVGLQDSVNVQKSTDIQRPANTERDETTACQSVSVEWKTPSCKSTLCPKPKFSKRKEDPSESNLLFPSSTQTSLATPQQSLDPQAEEWSLKSNMLPMDSDEIENWCEGVSHMLLSDAFVPVSEETVEKITDTKDTASSSLHKAEEHVLSRPGNETPSEILDEVHQLHTTADMSKTDKSSESLPSSQAKKSPARSTFQMTLRSPERRLKDQPHVLKSPQSAPKTPQRPQTLKSPSRQHTGEISRVCRVQMERLSVEEIYASQRVLQPKHHSTPVTVKTRGNEMDNTSQALIKVRSPGLDSQVDKKPLVPLEYSPKVVLCRIPVTATNANTSSPTTSPAKVSSSACRPPADLQSPQSSPTVSDVDSDMDPNQVSQFFLEDIFTEVEDPD